MRGSDLPQVKLDYIVPKGGLDLVTPPLLMPPGACRSAQNFEVDLEGGYSRIGGYERWAGQTSWTKQVYQEAALRLYAGSTQAFPFGVKIRGDTSGATGRLLGKLSDHTVNSVRVAGSDLSDFVYPGYLSERFLYCYLNTEKVVFLYEVSGTFILNENLSVLAEDENYINRGLAPTSPYGEQIIDLRITSLPVGLPQTTPLLYETELDRARIAGRGSVLGPANVIASGAPYFQAIESLQGLPLVFMTGEYFGWTLETALYAIYPSVKHSYHSVGEVFYGYEWTSAANDKWSGWGGGPIGTVPPLYLESVKYNFSGATNNERLYFVTGSTAAFSFHLLPADPGHQTRRGIYNTIPTGMATDVPEHIAAHKNRLFLSFGASLQFSTAGDPTSWSPVTGAGELAVGEQITKMQSVIGGDVSVLLVYTTTRIYGLYGDASTDFRLVLLASDIRVDPKSIQMFGQPIFLTDRGVMFLNAVDAFGNFKLDAVSNQIAPMLKRLTGRLTTSIVIPEKNQYRLFFDTGESLYFTFAGTKLIGVMPVYYDRVVEFIHRYQDEELDENILLFANNRNSRRVYSGDIGPAFDCRTIDAHFFLSFDSNRTARVNKSYRHAALELQAEEGYVTFKASFEADYATRQTLPTPEPEVTGSAVNAYSAYDDALWDEFYWDGNRVSPQELSIDGNGENFSFGVSSSSYLTWPFTLSGVILHYIVRRIKRG
jgi:hypothetical protein